MGGRTPLAAKEAKQFRKKIRRKEKEIDKGQKVSKTREAQRKRERSVREKWEDKESKFGGEKKKTTEIKEILPKEKHFGS